MKSTNFRGLGLAALLLLALTSSAFAQDTLRVMTYNLLRYGAQGISCTPVGVTTRNPYMLSIMGATMPDILGVNEVGPYSGPTSPASNILINILQPLNPAYRMATVTFNNSQDVANAMFYNSDKVGLIKEAVIPEPTLTLRDLNYYKFYYKGPGLLLGDTTFLEIVQVHLHSSSEQTRAVQTADVMNYLDGLGRSGNFIVQGDFNLDGSTAGSFQNMIAHTNPDVKLNDVLNLVGNWHGNTNARRAMTQATSSSPAPCGSGGALDDRFDHMIVSNALLNNTAGIRALANTYWVPGNTFSPNASVTSTVSNYLKQNSDHFPLVMDFEVSRAVASAAPMVDNAALQLRNNPSQGKIEALVQLEANEGPNCELSLIGLNGQLLKTWDFAQFERQQAISLDATEVAAGAYFLQLRVAGQLKATQKVLLLQP